MLYLLIYLLGLTLNVSHITSIRTVDIVVPVQCLVLNL
jgi:hypothetical protein